MAEVSRLASLINVWCIELWGREVGPYVRPEKRSAVLQPTLGTIMWTHLKYQDYA